MWLQWQVSRSPEVRWREQDDELLIVHVLDDDVVSVFDDFLVGGRLIKIRKVNFYREEEK